MIGAWLLVPQLGLSTIVRSWLAALWASLGSMVLAGTASPAALLTFQTGTVLTASLAAALPRVAMVAWRSYSFVRKRRKAALLRVQAAA